MNAAEVLRRLRRFLLLLSIMLFGGALIELWLVDHTKEVFQLAAFVLAGAGSLAALLALLRPGRASVQILRACMIVIVFGSIFGVYEHVAGNVAFEQEIHPDAGNAQLLSRGLRGGNPLLAPGVLAIAAVVAWSATYRHYASEPANPDAVSQQ